MSDVSQLFTAVVQKMEIIWCNEIVMMISPHCQTQMSYPGGFSTGTPATIVTVLDSAGIVYVAVMFQAVS